MTWQLTSQASQKALFKSKSFCLNIEEFCLKFVLN